MNAVAIAGHSLIWQLLLDQSRISHRRVLHMQQKLPRVSTWTGTTVGSIALLLLRGSADEAMLRYFIDIT